MIEYSPKARSKPEAIVSVWKNMTVAELANSMNRDVGKHSINFYYDLVCVLNFASVTVFQITFLKSSCMLIIQ